MMNKEGVGSLARFVRIEPMRPLEARRDMSESLHTELDPA